MGAPGIDGCINPQSLYLDVFNVHVTSVFLEFSCI